MANNTARAIAQLRSLTIKFKIAREQAKPIWSRLCTTIRSNGRTENYGGLGATSAVREWLGDRIFNEMRAAEFTIKNRDWEWSQKVDKNDLDDDTMGLYDPIFTDGGNEFAHHPDSLLVTECIIGGGSLECIDGQNFYDTDHSWGDSGNQSNKITATAVDPDNPTLAEVRAALTKARIQMIRFKNDQGNLFIRNALEDLDGMVAICAPELQQTMGDALIPVIIGTTPTKMINPPAVMSMGLLTNKRKFYLNYTGAPLKPFVMQLRKPVTEKMKGMDDPEFKNVKFMADGRYTVGPLAWWLSVEVEFVAP